MKVAEPLCLLCKAEPEQPGRKLISVLIWLRDAHTQQNKAGAGCGLLSLCNLFSIVSVVVDPEITEPEELFNTRCWT